MNKFIDDHHLDNISQKQCALNAHAKSLWEACGNGHIGEFTAQILLIGYELGSIHDMMYCHSFINMLTIDYEASGELEHPATTMKHIINVLWEGINGWESKKVSGFPVSVNLPRFTPFQFKSPTGIVGYPSTTVTFLASPGKAGV